MRVSFGSLSELGDHVRDRTDAELFELWRGDYHEVLELAFEALGRAVPPGNEVGVLEWTVGTPEGTVTLRLDVTAPGAERTDAAGVATVRVYSLFADCLRVLGGAVGLEEATRNRAVMVGGDFRVVARMTRAFGSAK